MMMKRWRSSPTNTPATRKYNWQIVEKLLLISTQSVEKLESYNFKPQHTCQCGFKNVGLITISMKTIRAYLDQRKRVHDTIRPRDMINELSQKFGVTVEYWKALRGRNKTIELIYDNHEESYHMLPQHLHILKKTNSATVKNIRADDDGRF